MIDTIKKRLYCLWYGHQPSTDETRGFGHRERPAAGTYCLNCGKEL